ncbi:hypothetical protein P3S67_007149 [Capsicum chacoense]
MWRFQQKLKRLIATLSQWSKEVFGDIYSNVKTYEEKVKDAEEKLILHNTDENRQEFHKIQVEYIIHLKVEDAILWQKYHLQWFKYGHVNSSYFYAFIRGRRRRLFIHKIKNEAGDWIQCDADIATTAVSYFHNIFTGTAEYAPEEILTNIPKFISEEQNYTLQAIPTLEEVKTVVFLMSIHSAAGPDGFVRGRNIAKNIMLAQEIIGGIKKPVVGSNVVIKLDMAKAYDRVSWSYTCLVLRRFGFGDLIIDMIWSTLSNNWYSISVDGTRYGFFHSTKGLKQGNPLSPSLFILGAEVPSGALKNLHHHPQYYGFYMDR